MPEEAKETWSYYRRSDEELRDLAKRLYDGHVFMLTDPLKIQMAFPILMFMSAEDHEALGAADIVAVYEHEEDIPKRGRAVNGMPMCFSCRFLDRQDFERLQVVYKRYSELRKRAETEFEGGADGRGMPEMPK
jgi:hypothetical protein